MSEAIAFLDLPDGRRLTGYGPFRTTPAVPASGVAFYRNDFGLGAAEPWWIPKRWEISERAVESADSTAGGPLACEWEAPDASAFAGVFQEISAAIRAGSFEKTVPVVVEYGSLKAAPGHALLEAAASSAGRLMGYGFSDGEAGFAGASPESLFSLSGGILRTMALAGTARAEEREVLAVDDKEIREHEYVAQALVSKLGDIGRVRRGPRVIMELGSIIHFHTPIEVELADAESPAALVRRLHPTPALGPLPRTPETMEQLIGWRRRLGTPEDFGAPFGALLDGDFHAIVAIRGLWWNGRELRLPAGCGVIEASRLVNEWRELRLKREAVKNRFGFPL